MNPIKYFIKKNLSEIGQLILNFSLRDQKFCIFSNDCWGGELYRFTKRPYNTPFVGLMLMAPCYINFLQNPKYYLGLDLKFKEGSKYTEMNKFWVERNMYPIGILDNVEVHFLHYDTPLEAIEKWNRRKERIDWANIYIKFSMDKDFSTIEILKKFDNIGYDRKVSFSKFDYNESISNIKLSNYDIDGARVFRFSLYDFNLIKWLVSGERSKTYGFNKLIGWFLMKFLK